MKWKIGLPPPQRNNLIAIDLEMFGLSRPRLHRPDGELALAAFADGNCVYVVDSIQDLRKAYANVRNNVLAFHNAMFDVSHLRRWVNFPPRSGYNIWDTMLVERVLWNGYYDEFSLADCVRRELGIQMSKEERKEFKGQRVPITKDMMEYNKIL